MAHASTPPRRDLRGQAFQKADLHDADLRCADLRGTNLSGADLRGADLRGALTGLGRRALVLKLAATAAACAGGGVVASWLGETIKKAMDSPDAGVRTGGYIVSAEIILCLIALVWRGTLYVLRSILPPTTALLFLAAVELSAFRGPVHGVRLALAVFALVGLFVVLVGVVSLGRAVASGSHNIGLLLMLVAWLLGAQVFGGQVFSVLMAVATAVAGMRARAGSSTSPRLSRWAHLLGTRGGTSFRGADLGGALVADARFRNSDFRGVRAEGVDWESCSELDFCQFDESPSVPPRKRFKRHGSPGPARA